MLPGTTGVQKVELKSRGSPMRPERAISPASRLARSKCRRYPTISLTPASRAARVMRSHSSSVSAIGFSTSTCLPARAARTAYSQCRLFGSAIYTASTVLRHASYWS